MPSPKKYLVVLEDLDGRGSQRAAQNYALFFHQQGWEVKVLGLKTGGVRADPLMQQGIEVMTGLNEANINFIQDWTPDVIHLHRPGLQNALFDQFFEFTENLKAQVLETNVFSRVDYALSEGVINCHLHLSDWCLWKWQQWAKALPYHPKGVVLPYSVDPESFKIPAKIEVEAFKKQIGINAKDFVFGRIGAADNAKWHPFLITAFQKIYESNQQVSLLLITPSPQVRASIESLPIPIRDKIITLPATHDDHELSLRYASIDCMMHYSSIGESFGMVLVESLLCGTPVVTYSTPLKDNTQVLMVEHGKNGYIARSKEQFIQCGLQVMEDEKVQKFMPEQLREQAIQLYNTESVGQRIMKLIANETSNPEVDFSFIKKELHQFPMFSKERLIFNVVHHPMIYKMYSSR